MRNWKSILSNRKGGVAIIFAASAMGISVLAGGGIDLARARSFEASLQAAADSTSLMVAREYASNQSVNVQTRGTALFNANMPDSAGDVDSVTTTVVNNRVRVVGVGKIDTTFLRIIGIRQFDARVVSQSSWGNEKIEVALVLDNTASMLSNSKFTNMKAAAKQLVSTLTTKITITANRKFAVVPFSNFVNVGSGNALASWMDTTGVSPYHSSYFSTSLNRFAIYTTLLKSWPGCVETRPAPYDTNDAVPTLTTPGTLFVPSFHPDEPSLTDGWGNPYYANSYLSDRSSSSNHLTRLTNATKYTAPLSQDYSNSNYYNNYNKPKGPGFFCDLTAITPLTSSKSVIDTAIDAMVALGSTNIPEGLAWGWRVLSPTAPFTEGVAYGSNETRKIVVLLTDGTNSINTFSTALGSAYSSWGYAYSGRLGSNPGTGLRTGLDAKLREVCANVKAAGIEIYTIGLMIDDTAGQQLLSDCSSGPDYYFNSPTSTQLDAVFASIADRIMKLRIEE